MTIRARKIVYQVHFDQLDDDGHLIGEPVVNARQGPDGQQEFLVLYPHEFGPELTRRVDELVGQVQAQLEPPPPNRASRRAAAKRSSNGKRSRAAARPAG